jgi:hypothetical protein
VGSEAWDQLPKECNRTLVSSHHSDILARDVFTRVRLNVGARLSTKGVGVATQSW